jgi:hypothetical protein
VENNHNFLNKSDAELQSEIERAFEFLQGNMRGAENSIGKILLVIAERNRRTLERLDRQNKLYTWLIIILTAVGIMAQFLPLWIKK